MDRAVEDEVLIRELLVEAEVCADMAQEGVPLQELSEICDQVCETLVREARAHAH